MKIVERQNRPDSRTQRILFFDGWRRSIARSEQGERGGGHRSKPEPAKGPMPVWGRGDPRGRGEARRRVRILRRASGDASLRNQEDNSAAPGGTSSEVLPQVRQEQHARGCWGIVLEEQVL